LKVILENKLTISKSPKSLETEIRDRLTFPNPKFIENERQGRWNGDTPPELQFYEFDRGRLIIPRGFIRQLYFMCRKWDEPFELTDNRRLLLEVEFKFNGQLRPFQETAIDKMMQHDFGTLAAPTGSGKTVMGLYLIAWRRQPTLIVVHTKELLRQWIDRIGAFLGIPEKEIGVIGAGRRETRAKITVATVQTLYKCADEVAEHIGHLVVDECHRAPSRTFTQAVTAFDSKYMLGLSATPWRRDKLSRLIFWHLGDVHHKVEAVDLIDTGDILEAEVITRETDFIPFHDPSTDYSSMLSELAEDEQRNRLICGDVVKESQNSAGICLVLSDRKSHCDEIRRILESEHRLKAEVLTGDVSVGNRVEIVNRLNTGKVKVLVATGQLIGEGFDCKGLSTLFLGTPIKFNGRVLQYVGRVLRPAPGKGRARVYDYVDTQVGVLRAAARYRQHIYDKQFRNAA